MNLVGNVGSGCSANVVSVIVEHIATRRLQGSVGVAVPASANEGWSVRAYEIPDFLGGGATNRDAPVEPGAYTFSAFTLSETVKTSFEVMGTFATQPSSRFVGMAPTHGGKGYWLAQKKRGLPA